MKKHIALLIVLLYSLSFTGCINTASGKSASSGDPSAFLLEKSLDLSSLMDQMAESKEFLQYNTSNDAIQTVVSDAAKIEPLSPNRAVIISAPDAFLDSLLQNVQAAGNTALPSQEAVLEQLKKRFGNALPNIWNGIFGGASWIAASSVLQVTETYEQPADMPRLTYVLLAYDDVDICTLTTFYSTSSGYLNAASSFILENDALKEALQAPDIKTALENLTFQADLINWDLVSFTPYTAEEIQAAVKR